MLVIAREQLRNALGQVLGRHSLLQQPTQALPKPGPEGVHQRFFGGEVVVDRWDCDAGARGYPRDRQLLKSFLGQLLGDGAQDPLTRSLPLLGAQAARVRTRG
jgi:hypothetical protein